MNRRAGILLEVMIALSIFAMAGLAILTLLGQSVESFTRTRDVQHAADLARSTMSRIEAGIAPPDALVGPVPPWDDTDLAREMASMYETGPGEFGPGFDDSLPGDSDWELEIESEPTEFRGLSLVTVRAIRRPSPDSDRILASYTLRQLVRLGSEDDDVVGQGDPLFGSGGSTGGGR